MKKILQHFFVCLMLPCYASGQKIDNLASFRDIESGHYFRFNYDNDFFTSSDEYYTQGYNFELVSPQLRKNPANHLFLKPKGNTVKYGLSLEHIGFTPTSILSDNILYGDRPFAAAFMLKSFTIATDTVSHSRLNSSFSIGMIGPAAFGGDMQTAIHRWTGNPLPLGWQHQIKNDVVLNYDVGYEHQMVRLGNFFSLQSNATIRLGTLFTNISCGLNATLGLLDFPFATGRRSKFSLYVYSQPVVNVIGYDATLQGGIFNSKSPYTIPGNAVERLTAQNNYGVVLKYKGLYLEYSRSILTREFETGKSNKWGGFKVGFKL